MRTRVVISEVSSGWFEAVVEGQDLVCRSRDPEHAVCREIVAAGLPDDPVDFVHGPSGMVAMRAPSSHRMAKWAVGHGTHGGFTRTPFKTFGEPRGSTQDGQMVAGR